MYFWPHIVCFIHHLWKHLPSKHLILYQEWSDRKKRSVSFVCRKALLGRAPSGHGRIHPILQPRGAQEQQSLVRICMLILFDSVAQFSSGFAGSDSSCHHHHHPPTAQAIYFFPQLHLSTREATFPLTDQVSLSEDRKSPNLP